MNVFCILEKLIATERTVKWTVYFNADIETSCVDGESSFDATMWGRILKMGRLDGHNFYRNREIEWIFTIITKRAHNEMVFRQIVEGTVFEIFAPFPLLPPPPRSTVFNSKANGTFRVFDLTHQNKK